MEFFDFINSVFDKEKWKNATDTDKRKYSFILVRRFTIMYPKEAILFNKLSTDEVIISDYLSMFFSSLSKKRVGSKPSDFERAKKLIWLKEKKNIPDEITKDYKKEVIRFFLNKHVITREDLKTIEISFPKELKSELDSVEKFLKTK
jgi:hypothetical protein